MASAEGVEPDISFGRRAIRWVFADRQSGRLIVVQWPNIWLWIFIVLTVGIHVHPAGGSAGHLIRVVADVALLMWAADELVRGVNPFRRILGLLVIGLTIYSLVQ
jgi:hypothetical protein